MYFFRFLGCPRLGDPRPNTVRRHPDESGSGHATRRQEEDNELRGVEVAAESPPKRQPVRDNKDSDTEESERDAAGSYGNV